MFHEKQDCKACVYLGSVTAKEQGFENEFNYDLYFCNASAKHRQTVIARFGPDSEYLSGLVFGKSGQSPILAVAYQLAIAKGLLPIDDKPKDTMQLFRVAVDYDDGESWRIDHDATRVIVAQNSKQAKSIVLNEYPSILETRIRARCLQAWPIELGQVI